MNEASTILEIIKLSRSPAAIVLSTGSTREVRRKTVELGMHKGTRKNSSREQSMYLIFNPCLGLACPV